MDSLVTDKDVFENYEVAHRLVQDKLQALFDAYNDLVDASPVLLGKYGLSTVLERFSKETGSSQIEARDVDHAYKQLKREAWKEALNRTKIKNLMTKSLREEFDKGLDQTAVLPFSADNLYNVMEQLYTDRKAILVEAARRVFNQFINYSFYATRKQGQNFEGWKTNAPDHIGIKFIVSSSTSYRKQDDFNDIDRVLCWMDGNKFDEIKTLYQCIYNCKHNKSNVYESEYFKFKLYGNGNAHITWKDTNLLALFNRIATEGEEALPSMYRKRTKNTGNDSKSLKTLRKLCLSMFEDRAIRGTQRRIKHLLEGPYEYVDWVMDGASVQDVRIIYYDGPARQSALLSDLLKD